MKVDIKRITIKKLSTQSESIIDIDEAVFTHMGMRYVLDRDMLSYVVRMIENLCIIYPQSMPSYSIELDYGHYQKMYLIDPGHNRALENIQRNMQGYGI